MEPIELEYLADILQDLYNTFMIEPDDVGMSFDEICMYVVQFGMDEDMLFSFIKEKAKENGANLN